MNQSFEVRLYVDGALAQSVTIGPLKAGTYGYWMNDALSNLYATPGNHELRLEVDPANAVREENESDNVFVKTFTVAAPPPTPTPTPRPPPTPTPTPAAQPNLTAAFSRFFTDTTDMEAYESDSSPGTFAVFIRCIAQNQGAGDSPPASFKFYVDNNLVKTVTTSDGSAYPGLKAGEQVYQTARVEIPAGTHTFRCVVDEENNIKESNESDNVATLTQTLTARPRPTSTPPPPPPPPPPTSTPPPPPPPPPTCNQTTGYISVLATGYSIYLNGLYMGNDNFASTVPAGSYVLILSGRTGQFPYRNYLEPCKTWRVTRSDS